MCVLKGKASEINKEIEMQIESKFLVELYYDSFINLESLSSIIVGCIPLFTRNSAAISFSVLVIFRN